MDEKRNLPEQEPTFGGGDGTIFFAPATSFEMPQELPLDELPLTQEPVADPLESAEFFPGLFPNEEEPLPEPSLESAETIASRPIRKKRKKIWTVLRIIGTVLLSLVLTVAVLAAGLLAYLTVTEYHPAYAESAKHGAANVEKIYQPLAGESKTEPLRILTFNTGYAGLDASSDFFMDGGKGVKPSSEDDVKKNMQGIETILRQADADLLLLQEVDTDSDRSFHQNQWIYYENALQDYESRFALNYSCKLVPYPLFNRIGQVQSGLATYSRYDITSATRFSLPGTTSWPVRTCYLKRCMLVTRLHIENLTEPAKDEKGEDIPNAFVKELVVVNVHLEAYDSGEDRKAQAEQLLEFIQQEYAKGNYVIVGGDFNQAFPNSTVLYGKSEDWQPGELLELPQGWEYVYDNLTPSCRLLNEPYDPQSGDTQYYVIDGYIVSPNVTVSKVETLDEDFRYSDHNPVLLEVTLEREQTAE